MEGSEAERTLLGDIDWRGPAGLAHRMLGDGDEVSGRHAGYSHGWHRSGVPAPRERDCAERGSHRKAIREVLAARRAFAGGRREDVQVAGEFLHPAGSFREGVQAVSAAIRAGERALSPATEFHV